MKVLTGALCALALLAGSAAAEPVVGVRSVRVGASDVFAVAAFYQKVFGLKEVSRVERPDLKESIMNFGATVEEVGGEGVP